MELEELDHLVALAGPAPGDGMAAGPSEPGDDIVDRLAGLGEARPEALPDNADADFDRLVALGRRQPAAKPKARAAPHRSPEGLAIARLAKERKRVQAIATKATADANAAREGLGRVAESFPLVGQASGVPLPPAKRLRRGDAEASHG